MENLILDNGSEAEYLADTCDYDFNDLVTNNKDMKKKVLKLTLKRKWYNLIAIGAKREEYREIKEY